jgi:PBSX family phage terminase large subunit
VIDLQPFGEKAHAFAFRPVEQDKRINILDGSIRSSKTWQMIPKLLQLCVYEVKGQRIITGVSKQTIKQNILNDLFDLLGEDNYTYNGHSGDLTLFNSKWIVIGAKDEGSEKYIRGVTVGIAYSDELTLMPKSFLMMLFGRMSPANARFYGTTNPDTPYHYLKEEILENPAYQAHLYHAHYTLADNPNLSEEYKEFVTKAYTGVWYDRYILGKWVIAQGAIYRDVLTPDIFYHNWHEPDDSCKECDKGIRMAPQGLRGQGGYVERYIGVDYGTVNPCVFCEFLDDGVTLWADREYYWDSKKERQQKTDSDYADDLIDFAKSDGKRDSAQIIIDPSAASFRVELQRRGVYVKEADNEVNDGIRMTASMLGLKRLLINVNCVNGKREMETYSWNEKKSKLGDEEPIKTHDHWPDQARYVIKTQINSWRLEA